MSSALVSEENRVRLLAKWMQTLDAQQAERPWGGDLALNFALIFANQSSTRCGTMALQDDFLRYMQDPELHALIYGQRKLATTPLI